MWLTDGTQAKRSRRTATSSSRASGSWSLCFLRGKVGRSSQAASSTAPFPTQEYAQHEARRFAEPALADSPDDEEENTSMSEPNSNAAQQQEAPQYVTKAKFDRLVAYVQELVTEHNLLDARVVELERHEQNRQRIENEIAARK